MWCSGAGDWGSSRTCTLCTNWQPIDRQCNRGRLERALSKQHRARHAQHCDSKNVPPRDLGRKACAAAPRPTFTPHSRQSWAAPLKASPGRCVLPFRGAPPQSPLTPQSAPSRQLPPPAPSQPPLPSLLFLFAPPRSSRAVVPPPGHSLSTVLRLQPLQSLTGAQMARGGACRQRAAAVRGAPEGSSGPCPTRLAGRPSCGRSQSALPAPRAELFATPSGARGQKGVPARGLRVPAGGFSSHCSLRLCVAPGGHFGDGTAPCTRRKPLAALCSILAAGRAPPQIPAAAAVTNAPPRPPLPAPPPPCRPPRESSRAHARRCPRSIPPNPRPPALRQQQAAAAWRPPLWTRA
jgi:hypothetical protein